jgi:hypothetical protein
MVVQKRVYIIQSNLEEEELDKNHDDYIQIFKNMPSDKILEKNKVSAEKVIVLSVGDTFQHKSSKSLSDGFHILFFDYDEYEGWGIYVKDFEEDAILEWALEEMASEFFDGTYILEKNEYKNGGFVMAINNAPYSVGGL